MNSSKGYLLLALMGVIGGLIAAIPDVAAPVRIAIGVPFVLLLPGLAMAGALLPDQDDMGIAERLVLALGISLVVAVLMGLLLHLMSAGLRPGTWALGLALVTVAASIVAAVRTSRGLTSARRAPRLWRLGKYPAVTFGVAALLGVSALTLAAWGATHQPAADFTELWAIADPSSESIVVGVRNREDGPRTYRLEVTQGDELIGRWSVSLLPDGEAWTTSVSIPPSKVGDSLVVARLFSGQGGDDPYREVHVVTEGLRAGS